MMATEPTPQEASDALREISARKQQAVGRNSQPKWVLWATAALVLALGLTSDLSPQLRTPVSYLVLAFVLVVTILSRWKRLGSAIGYQRSPSVRPAMSLRTRLLNILVLLVMIVLVLVLGASALLRDSEVPYPGTIASVLIVVTMPLWQRFFGYRMRGSRAEHG